MPRSSACFTTSAVAASSSVQSCSVPALPKLMQLTQTFEISMSVFPNFVYSIPVSFLPAPAGCCAAFSGTIIPQRGLFCKAELAAAVDKIGRDPYNGKKIKSENSVKSLDFTEFFHKKEETA